MDKFKIEIILRSSSPKQSKIKQSQRAHFVPQYQQGVLYARSPSAALSLPYETHISLREKIINPKQCLSRPASQREKQSQMFTEKCLQILSKKRKLDNSSSHKAKMHAMIANVVDKYKKTISCSRNQFLTRTSFAKPLDPAKTESGCMPFLGFQDKIEVYRMIKSTQFPKAKDEHKAQKKENQNDWKSKPDVTGVRMNNRILKFQKHDIEGVQCFSLPISELPLTKRQTLICTQPSPQPRTHSSNSYRRKVSISRVSSQKFMAFSLNQDSDGLYMKKLKSFLDFIFKVNYSNNIYVNLQLSEDTANIKKYKVYIGKGNNSLLIKSLLKRRFWLELVEDPEEEDINFYWSQNKINRVHYKQNTSKNLKLSREAKEGRKKEPRDAEERQTWQLNRKILPFEECGAIEQFICRDGFLIPQEEKYACTLVTNHLPRNSCIGSKKNLFKSLFYYYRDYLKLDPFDFIPKTFNVKGPEDSEFKRFLREYENEPKKVWIIKPGENSNRGNGIKLAETSKVIDAVRKKEKHDNGQLKTYIIQSYIEKPFLYNNRKFDIRHYMMMTSVNGIIKCYWYKEGYIRTSSEKYDIEDLGNEQIHLTNDAIQKKYEQYEKYEAGNKLSYPQFQRYLDLTYPGKGYNFEKDIVSKMKSVVLDVMKANYNIIDKCRRQCNFEIFGFDFMIDREFKPWLIEINFNPCLEINCPVLSRIIPSMVENSLRLGLDPLLPPCNHYPGNKRFSLSDNFLRNLKYELLFDEFNFHQTIPILHEIEDSDDEEQEYNDEGKEIEELVM